jgi:hypothetical protein
MDDTAAQVAPKSELSINLEKLLFGAIAINLIGLMCWMIVFGIEIVAAITYGLFTMMYLRGLTLFYIFIGGIAIFSQLAQIFAWGARGFVERRVLRIGTLTIFFTLYGIAGVYSGFAEGYVALGTVIFTSLVVALTHYNDIVSRLRNYF